MNTVSLEVAKELYELGWESHTYFEYDLPGYAGADYYPEPRVNSPIKQSYIRPKPVLPAPQIHEILEVLPAYIKVGKIPDADFYYLTMEKDDRYYMISYDNLSEEKSLGESEWDENPHDAAAKLLIWCVKNNYVTL